MVVSLLLNAVHSIKGKAGGLYCRTFLGPLNDGAESTQCRERIDVQLASSWTGLASTKKEYMLLFACIKAAESKRVKLETSSTVILLTTMSALWMESPYPATV